MGSKATGCGKRCQHDQDMSVKYPANRRLLVGFSRKSLKADILLMTRYEYEGIYPYGAVKRYLVCLYLKGALVLIPTL